MSHDKLRAYNVVWDSPSADSSGSMPLGNGDIGLNVWVEQNGDLLFYISKSDAWNENNRLLKLGRVRVSLSPNPFAEGASFRQELKLLEGEIEIVVGVAGSSVNVRVWVDANQSVINVEVVGEQPVEARATLECWRNESRELTGAEAASAYGLHGGPNPIIESPDTILHESGTATRIAWVHQNSTSIWADTLELQGLDTLVEQSTDPLLNNTFGAIIQAEGFVNESASILVSEGARTRHFIRVLPHTQQTLDIAEWMTALEAKIQAIESLNVAEALQAHRDWWQKFWERSWIFVSGDERAEIVTRGYILQRFISACAGRGAFPIKFNGSLFTVDAREPDENYDADYRRWGGPYWFQNTRLAYWPMLGTGDFEMMRPLFKMYVDALPLAQERTQIYFGHEGAFFPETMTFWGLYASTNYGWEREGKPVSHVDNTYIRYYWSGALELIVLMMEFYKHTGDEAFLEDSLIPFSTAVLQFYDQHYTRDEAGKLFISPAQSLEMWQEADNPLPEVAGLHRVLGELLALPGTSILAEQRSDWQRLQAELPPIPLRELDGQTLIAAAQVKTDVAMNIENPELYAVFPYRIYGVGQPELEMAVDTYFARGIKSNIGWQQDPIQAAYLGLADEAAKLLSERFALKHEGSRFPAFWGPNYDWIPDQDHGGVAQIALQAMLLQNVGEKTVLLPAWPAEWDVEFKLHATNGSTIEASYRGGQLLEMTVQPPSHNVEVLVGEAIG